MRWLYPLVCKKIHELGLSQIMITCKQVWRLSSFTHIAYIFPKKPSYPSLYCLFLLRIFNANKKYTCTCTSISLSKCSISKQWLRIAEMSIWAIFKSQILGINLTVPKINTLEKGQIEKQLENTAWVLWAVLKHWDCVHISAIITWPVKLWSRKWYLRFRI